MITLENLSKIYQTPKNILKPYIDPLNKTIEQYNINNIPMFIAQIGAESGGLKFVSENLNYSAQRLIQVFPKYCNGINPIDYARKPEKIANRVYANRLGNGPECSGDGYKFRGRGAIQLTGKYNYQRFADSLQMSLDEVTEFLNTPDGIISSAGWFWNVNNINSVSDDIIATTKKINGGLNGLTERKKYYSIAQNVLKG